MKVARLAWLAFFDLLPSGTKVDEHWPTPLVDVGVTMKIGIFLTGSTVYTILYVTDQRNNFKNMQF